MEEGFEMIEKVLCKMKEGSTVDELAKELDLRKSTVQAVTEFMYVVTEKGWNA